jgi:hypothetical protein
LQLGTFIRTGLEVRESEKDPNIGVGDFRGNEMVTEKRMPLGLGALCLEIVPDVIPQCWTAFFQMTTQLLAAPSLTLRTRKSFSTIFNIFESE